MGQQSWWLTQLLRPSLWVAFITVIAYWDEQQALHGSFVYDDGGSVRHNVVVNGNVPWRDVWIRDYWGTMMSEPQSHKSFRPITTLTFRLNWILMQGESGEGTDTFWFHVVNLVLHGIVTGLATETAAIIFQDSIPTQLVTGLIFGLHPVHVEAVTNITSRGELLMSFFALVAFLVYARSVATLTTHNNNQASKPALSIRTTAGIYFVPWFCMFLSVFSKEQGATTLVTLVLYDFIHHQNSVVDLWNNLRQWQANAIAFARRTFILAAQSLLVAGFRYWLNGESIPDFIKDQNPAGFAEDRFTRVFSVSWVYCLYIWDAVYPANLCPDWSGVSIDLISEWSDWRVGAVVALWIFSGSCLVSLIVGLKPCSPFACVRRPMLTAFFAFLFSPFLLSSNLLVVVGLMKADRVVYLPLLGFAMLEALLFKSIFCDDGRAKVDTVLVSSSRIPSSKKYWLGHAILLFQLFLFTIKLHERNVAWSSPLNLWMSAYAVNKRSRHTIYNCGYELSLKQRYAESEEVLRSIGSARVEGPSNTFVYAMVLFNLDRCDEVQVLVEDAIVVVDEKRLTGGTRNSDASLKRTKSNLMVAQAFCTSDIPMQGKIIYDAVQEDPTNQYAIDQAMKVVKRVEAYENMQSRSQRHSV